MSDKLITFCHETNLSNNFVPTDLEWMNDIKPLDEFFTWLENCVSDRNCITPEELNTYKILSESGKFEEGEEETTGNNHPPENINVYPHERDLDMLENLRCQNQMRLASYEDYFNLIKTNERTVDHSKLDFKVNQMLENEVRRVNCLVAGEYRRTAFALATKCAQLNENLENITDSVNSDLICLTPMKTFCDLMEYLHLYATKIIEKFLEQNKTRRSIPSSEVGNGDSSSYKSFDSNLHRVFNDCIRVKAECVKRQSQIEGITVMCQTLNQSDLVTVVIPECDQADEVLHEDLYMVCYDQMRAELLKYEARFDKETQIKKRRILASLEYLRDIARPLKLCGDAVVSLVRDEYKWFRTSRALISDCYDAFKEIHHQVEQTHKRLLSIQTVSELSSVSHTFPEGSATFLKLFESHCDVSTTSHKDTASSIGSTWSSDVHDKKIVDSVMTRMFADKLDSAFRTMKSFSEDTINLLSHARRIYRFLFNGPSATMSFDWDLMSSVIRLNQELKSRKDQSEKLVCRHLETEIRWKNNERRKLMEIFWLLYYQNPQQLRQIVESIEARAKLRRTQHSSLVKDSDADYLESLF